MTLIRQYTLLSALAALALAGCALNPPGRPPKPELPEQWSAPLPHGGDAKTLAAWWEQFDDPELARLIDATQARNGDLAQAAARIEEARANVRIAGAARYPAVDGQASATRSSALVPVPTGTITSTSLGVDALWEIDLFGVTRNNVEAAAARADSAQLSWHELRVSLAAEAATTYVSLRACEQLADIYTQDTVSSQRRAQLTDIKVKAGLESRANGALARAAAAEASNRLIGQRADCDVLVKALVGPHDAARAGAEKNARRRPRPAAAAEGFRDRGAAREMARAAAGPRRPRAAGARRVRRCRRGAGRSLPARLAFRNACRA